MWKSLGIGLYRVQVGNVLIEHPKQGSTDRQDQPLLVRGSLTQIILPLITNDSDAERALSIRACLCVQSALKQETTRDMISICFILVLVVHVTVVTHR